MKTALFVYTALSLTAGLFASAKDAPEAWGAVPSAAQLRYHRQETAALISYGPNTYTGRNGVEWGDSGTNTEDRILLPETLDTDQWVQAAQAAGMKRIILVAKHHDGFRLWKTDAFSLAQTSPARNPKGIDLAEELSKSCTKFGVDMGFYLSPWDVYEDKGRAMLGRGEGFYGNGSGTPGLRPMNDDYNRMFVRHLREIFGRRDKKYGRNGNICELWLDGAKNAVKQQVYDFDTWIRTAKSLSGTAPDGTKDPAYECIVFQGGEHQEVAWPGTETGLIDESFWSKMSGPLPQGRVDWTRKVQGPLGSQWVIWEGDFPMRPGWFYHGNQDGRTKQGPELFRRFLTTAGRGGIMLVGLAPDVRGRISDEDLRALTDFGRLRRKTFGEHYEADLLRTCPKLTVTADVPLRNGNPAYAADRIADTGADSADTYWAPEDSVRKAVLTVNFGKNLTFDMVRLQEYIPLGQRIDGFTVEAHTATGWTHFHTGRLIAYQRLLDGPVTTADRLRITVRSPYAAPILSNIGLFKLPPVLERQEADLPAGLSALNDSVFRGTPAGDRVRRFARPAIEGRRHLLGGDITLVKGGAFRTAEFTGSKFWIRGAKEVHPGVGADMKVSVDGHALGTAEMTAAGSSDPRHPFPGNAQGMILFTSPDLTDGPHTVRMESTDPEREIMLDALVFLPAGRSCFEFADVGPADADEGCPVTVTVRRLGDTSRAASVRVASHPGTAVHGEDFIQEAPVLTFAPGEREKRVTFRTRDNFKKEGPQYFELRLEALPGTPTAASFNAVRRVVIRDND